MSELKLMFRSQATHMRNATALPRRARTIASARGIAVAALPRKIEIPRRGSMCLSEPARRSSAGNYPRHDEPTYRGNNWHGIQSQETACPPRAAEGADPAGSLELGGKRPADIPL